MGIIIVTFLHMRYLEAEKLNYKRISCMSICILREEKL